jgi:aryl-alcohol dehydrogenase-like predicted oxidoreductase
MNLRETVVKSEPTGSEESVTRTLPTRPLGSSGLEITTVGFGAWAIGGGGWAYGWGPQDDTASLATMRHALGLGVNWIDTAAIYGLGHSEEVVGSLLHELPPADRPFVFTKCGPVPDERDRIAEPQHTLRPGSIRRECEALQRGLLVVRLRKRVLSQEVVIGRIIEDDQ